MALVEVVLLMRIGPFVCAAADKVQIRTRNNKDGQRMKFPLRCAYGGSYLKLEFKSWLQLRTIEWFAVILLRAKSARENQIFQMRALHQASDAAARRVCLFAILSRL